ncbi:hypothetical protein RAA17_02570 [Komagataeibacter rhaeticus]|nr:hypothetical protein [Komagataeibacter rhaeticus]
MRAYAVTGPRGRRIADVRVEGAAIPYDSPASGRTCRWTASSLPRSMTCRARCRA